MAIALVGEVAKGSGSGASVTVSVTRAPSPGNLLVARLGFRGSTGTTYSSVTDSKGNTWTIDVQHNVSSGHAAVASTAMDAGVLTTADTITFTPSASVGNGLCAIVDEFSGADTSASRVDATATGTASGTARDGGTLATSNANDLLVAAYTGNSTAAESSFTPGTGFSNFASPLTAFGTTNFVEGEYQIVSATGSYDTPGTGSGSLTTQGAAVAYKAAAGSTPQTVSLTGLGSAASLGAPTPAVGGVTRAVAGVGSASAFGAPTATPGGVTAALTGLGSAALFGSPTPVPGNRTVPTSGLASAAQFGRISVAFEVFGLGSAAELGVASTGGGTIVPVVGLSSAALVGAPSVLPGAVVARPAGLGSAAQFGTAAAFDMTAIPPSLGTAAVFGVPFANTPGGITFDPAVQGGHYT